jgi:hypothetical protein
MPSADADGSNAAATADDGAERPTEMGPSDDSRHDAPEETWMVCYAGGAKVGYSHTRMEPVTENGEKLLRYSYNDQLTMKRFRDTTVVRTRLSSLETIDGCIVDFRSEIMTGPGAVVTQGRYDDGKLAIQVTTQDKTENHSIPWNPQWGGFFADQRSLRKEPMNPRETRRLKALLPIVNQAGEIRMNAVGYEAAGLLSGSRQLLRIDAATDLGMTQLKTILWTDETGKVWKTRDLQLGLEAYRTTKEDALSGENSTALDLGDAIVIQIDRRLEDPHHTRRIVYRARLKDGEVKSLFATGATQSVKIVDDRTAEVTVRAIRPDEPPELDVAEADRPTEADSAPSAMIQSDDARVMTMAGEAAPDETDAWDLACAFERHVKQRIRLKNYSTAMATAAEVAKSLEGDCTEHAMLLAALCRARKIPARVAIGLVYYPAAGGFAYHMWTEAWIENRWVPLDATLGLGGIGAAHLKFAHSSMHGVSALAELLPVIKAIGRLELEIVSVE